MILRARARSLRAAVCPSSKKGENRPAPKAGGVSGPYRGRWRRRWVGVMRSNLGHDVEGARSLAACPACPSSKKGPEMGPPQKRAASGAVSGSAASMVSGGHEEQPEA
jgi:hypothetical protein